MKKYNALLLAFFICSFTTILYAEAAPKQPLVKVGFFGFSGYHEIDADGTRNGYGYEFLQKLARYTGWNYEYVGYDKSWNEMQQMLADGEIDILTSAQKTPEREKIFDFSERPIGTNDAILTARSGETKFVSGDYSTYNGMRVGMLNGSSRNSKFESFAREHSFTYTSVCFDTTEDMLTALHTSHTVDTLLTSNLRKIKNEWILDSFDPSDFYVIVKKGNHELLDEINESIKQMDTYEPLWRKNLWDTFYKADTGEEIAFSPAERTFIAEAKEKGTVLTAIINPDRAPYSYFEEGSAKGIIPELFTEIEKRTGLTFNIIYTKDRASYWKKVGDRDTDVRIDTYFNYSTAEQLGFKLTDPYIDTTIARITKKSFTGTPQTIAALRYADKTIPYKTVTSATKNVVYFDSIKDCVNAVKNGSVDATYLYTYTAQKFINEDTRSSLTMTIYPQYEVSFALGVSSSSATPLLTILNKAVDSIQTDFSEQIISNQTSKMTLSLSLTDYLALHPLIGILCLLFITFMLILIIVLVMHQNNMNVLEHKNKELASAIEKADKASRAKSNFLSRMSHEMRTPMNAIVGITSIAKDHVLEPAKTLDYLNKISSSSHLLLGIINDVLDMSAIENNKLIINLKSFNLKDTLFAINAMYDVQCNNKNIHFSLNDKTNDDVIIGDELRVNQILINLISNSYKFTPSGGFITLNVETVSSDSKTEMIQFTVSDNGCGMTEEMLSRLFLPFEQESADTSQKYGGSGLGLAITKRLVDLMGASISVESKKNQGTTFIVTIPFAKDTITYIPNEISSNEEIHIDFTGRNFLLVEDNELNREIAVELLSSMHAHVDIAENGLRAVQIFESSEQGTYDLILMDMQMPELNGVEATKKIRECSHSQAKQIPILAMTANAYQEDIDACLAAGMNGHLAKPIEPDALYKTINSFLK